MTRIAAHRGVSSLAPENTLPAFAKAIEVGADEIELDVHLSLDGELMVIHDEKLIRTTGAAGTVGTTNSQDLRKLSAHAGMENFRGVQIPFLGEVFELIRPSSLAINIELKTNLNPYPGIEKKIMQLADDMGMRSRIFFSSFNHQSLVRMKEIAPDMETAILYSEGIHQPWNYARKIVGADSLHPHFHQLRMIPEYMQACKELGVKVRPWTVDSDEDIRSLLQLDVDCIITNVPQNALPIRAAFAKE